MPAAEPSWGALLVAAGFGAWSYLQYSRRRQRLADADEIQTAQHVDLTGLASPAQPAVVPGQLLSVKGEVVVFGEPLESRNKEKCAVIETVVKTERTDLSSPYVRYADTKDRSVRDTAWGLRGTNPVAVQAGTGVTTVTTVQVERDAVRRGVLRDPEAASDLLPGGAEVKPRETSFVKLAADLFWGQREGDTIIVDSVLPVGVAATVLGRAELGAGGALFIGLHPRLGLYLHRSDLTAVAGKFRWAATWNAVGTVLTGGIAAYAAWRFVVSLRESSGSRGASGSSNGQAQQHDDGVPSLPEEEEDDDPNRPPAV